MAWRALLLLLAAGRVAADAPPPEVPPLALPTALDHLGLPAGVPVSRPLGPAVPRPESVSCSPPADLPPTPTTALMELAEVDQPLGHSWHTLELLLWWPRAGPLPPLLVSGTGAAPPLVGGRSLDTPVGVGGRVTVGFAVNPDETAGLTVSYLFLGPITARTATGDLRTAPTRPLGRPVLRADTGGPGLVPVAVPGTSTGVLTASTSTRVTGWEVGGVANLHATDRLRLNAVAGYRYFMANEGLRVDQFTLTHAAGQPPTLVAVADQFDAHNRFHGGQFGLLADFTRGPVFVEASGKVGFGQSLSVVRVSGRTLTSRPGGPVRVDGAGVLAQPSNNGRFVRGGFAVLPEGTLKVGYRLADRSRFYVGYDFLYLSEAARPGEQVDRTLVPADLPLLGGAGAAGDRPAPVLHRSDFWVQGLTFGLEYRY